MLDEFDLVALGGVDEGDDAAGAGGRGAIAQRKALRRGVAGEGVEIVHLEGEMREVRADDDRAARVELAKLDEFLAARRFQKNEPGAAGRSAAAHLFEAEHVAVEGHGPVEVGDAVAGVKEALNHREKFRFQISGFGFSLATRES